MSDVFDYLRYIAKKVKSQSTILEKIIMNQEEFTSQLEAVAANLESAKARLEKSQAEIIAHAAAQATSIADLQAALSNSGGVMSQAATAALARIQSANDDLTASVQAIDDLNPDAPQQEQVLQQPEEQAQAAQ